jgi:hypothetical protein
LTAAPRRRRVSEPGSRCADRLRPAHRADRGHRRSPAAAVGATAALYALVAVLVFGWVDRQPVRRRAVLAVGYVLVQLALGYVVFSLAHAGVGATLLLLVLVSQGVLLLPLPAAVVVTAAVPRPHLGAIGGMSAVMYLPLLVLLVPFWAGAITGGTLLVAGQLLMLPAMALAMLWRRSEYLH